jgi:hypothetical protein
VPPAREAIELAKEANDPHTLLQVLTMTALVLARPSELYDSDWRTKHALELAFLQDDQAQLVLAAYNRAAHFGRSGHLAGIDQMIELLESRRDRSRTALVLRHQIGCYRNTVVGEFAAALIDANRALELGKQTGATEASILYFYQSATIAYATGASFANVVDPGPKTGRHEGVGPAGDSGNAIRGIICMSTILAGNLDQGLALLVAEASNEFADIAHDHMWLQTMDLWCNAAFLLRVLNVDHDSLRDAGVKLAEALTPFASGFAASHIGISAPVASAVGCCIYSAGERDKAIQWFEAATDLCAVSGFTYCLAQTQAQLAIVLLHSNVATPAERETAAQLIQNAGSWADSRGAVKVSRLVALGEERLLKLHT